MIPIPLIVAGIGALGSILGKKGSSGTTQSTETKGTLSTDTTVSPTYDPLQLSARNTALQYYLNRLKPANFTGYALGGLRNINEGANLRQKTLGNILAARGLTYSPAGFTPSAMVESQRISDITNFENQLPLLQRQLQAEDLAGLSSFVSSLPTGTKQVGTQTSTGSGTGINSNNASWMNALGGGINDALSMYLLAKYYGKKPNDSGWGDLPS